MKEIWDSFLKMLTEYNMGRVLDLLRQVNWYDMLVSPWAWIVAIPFLVLVLWKRQLRLLVLGVSFALFVWLLQNSLPAAGQPMPLSQLLEFIAGTGALVGVNLYFLFIREK